MAQEGMFWKLLPEDVIGKPAEQKSADYGFMRRVKKDIMEMATGVTSTESGWGPRTLQLTEYILREFWAMFVDDRAFHKDSLYWHANLRNDSDGQDPRKIHEEKCVGSKFAACMWTYNKMVLAELRTPTPEMQEYRMQRMLSILL